MLVDPNGSVYVAPPPPVTPRTPEEEAAADEARAQSLGDEWLRELEAAAQAQWAALMGG